MTDRRQAISAQIRALVDEYFALDAVPGARGTTEIPLHVPSYGAAEVNEALASLLSTRVTMGEKVRRFEALWAEYVGAGQAVMVNSGSSANLIAAEALRSPFLPRHLQPGDEVIVPAVLPARDDRRRAGPGGRRPRHVHARPGRRRGRDRPAHARDHGGAPPRQRARHGGARRAGAASRSLPARGRLRGSRRAVPRRESRELRARRGVQLLLLAPHQHDRGRDGRHRGRAPRRPGADAARARLAARRAQEARRAESGDRRALLLRELRLQPAAHGAPGGVRHPPDGAARAVHPDAPGERGVLEPVLREVRRPAPAVPWPREWRLALGLVRLPADRPPGGALHPRGPDAVPGGEGDRDAAHHGRELPGPARDPALRAPDPGPVAERRADHALELLLREPPRHRRA